MISDIVGTRSCSQVRSHAQKYFNRERNKEERIGNPEKIKIRGENDHAITRRASSILRS